MRYPASEKLEIIRIVEQSHLPAKRTLDQLGVARRTFYRWYDRYLEGGPGVEDAAQTVLRIEIFDIKRTASPVGQLFFAIAFEQ